jgi:ATP-dependent RNA helicase SUPV3L1/SUV3
MDVNARLAGRVTAVLGPTNTGKTHFAIERMLSHRTGVIGLPLRLLAREVYDRIVALRGPSVVALITGEERILPPRAAYYVCTVEAMPLEIGADGPDLGNAAAANDDLAGDVLAA